MILLALGVSIVALAGAWWFGGQVGVIGMALGLFGTAFNIGALWGVINFAAKSVLRAPTSRTAGCLLVVGLFVKLPLIIGLGLFANKIGGAAPSCFLAGLGIVYTALAIYGVRDGMQKAQAEKRAAQTDDRMTS